MCACVNVMEPQAGITEHILYCTYLHANLRRDRLPCVVCFLAVVLCCVVLCVLCCVVLCCVVLCCVVLCCLAFS